MQKVRIETVINEIDKNVMTLEVFELYGSLNSCQMSGFSFLYQGKVPDCQSMSSSRPKILASSWSGLLSSSSESFSKFSRVSSVSLCFV